MAFTGTGQDWERGLIIKNICDLAGGAKYKVSYDIWASQEMDYTVSYNDNGEYGDSQNAFNETVGEATGRLTAKPDWKTEHYTINATKNGNLWIRWNVGLANGDTEVS